MEVATKWKSEVTDAELVGLAVVGDKEAFDLLVKRYQRAVYAMAFAVLSDSEAAQDVLQDTFLAAYCSLKNLEDPSRFGAWIYAITRNRARGYYRSRRRRNAREICLDAIELAERVEVSERAEAIRHALSSLSESQADVITLYYMEGYSVFECATLLETSIGNIKRRLYDARQRLKKEMTSMIRKHLPEFALPKDYKVVIDTSGKVCTTQTVLEDLSKMTGVVFEAGKDKLDWAVRGRKINIIANNVPLIDLMESITNVLNCEWSMSDDDNPTYRLYMDEKTQKKAEEARMRAQEHFDTEMTRRRQEFVDRMLNWHDVSREELERMKTENPCRYLLHVRGSGYMYQRFFKEIPGLAESFINRKTNMPFKVMDLSQETRNLIRRVLDERFKYRGYHGSRDGNPFPEEYDINCPEAYMWFEIVPRDFIWDITQNWDMGGVGVFVRDRFFYVEDMLGEDVARAKYHARLQILALETGKTFHDLNEETKNEEKWAKQETAKDFARCYGEELQPNNVDDDPDLQKKIHVKMTGDTLADYQAALAEAVGLAVVSDLYLARRDTAVYLEEKEIELRELLNSIAIAYDYRWTKRGQVIEFQDNKWFARTGSQIPLEQIATLRKNLLERGYLTLDEYAEIAALTNEQIEESLMPDETLSSTGIFNWPLMRARIILRFYLSLDELQRELLFSLQGLDLRSLAQEQFDLAMKTFENLDENNELPKILAVKDSSDRWLVMQGEKEINSETGLPFYRFLLQSNEGEHLRGWGVNLPALCKE